MYILKQKQNFIETEILKVTRPPEISGKIESLSGKINSDTGPILSTQHLLKRLIMNLSKLYLTNLTFTHVAMITNNKCATFSYTCIAKMCCFISHQNSIVR